MKVGLARAVEMMCVQKLYTSHHTPCGHFVMEIGGHDLQDGAKFSLFQEILCFGRALSSLSLQLLDCAGDCDLDVPVRVPFFSVQSSSRHKDQRLLRSITKLARKL